MDKSDVVVIIPTLNEEATIKDVIEDFKDNNFKNIVVIDGGSTDNTREIVSELDVTLLEQSGDGKGKAVKEALEHISEEYIILIDGDGTYDPSQADRILEELKSGVDHVVGNRFADLKPGSMHLLNKYGNKLINWLFTTIHREEYKDILSGYRGFTKESIELCELNKDGFEIETEIMVECARNNLDVSVVPISYYSRHPDSTTNLRPFYDGFNISLSIYTLSRSSNPLFYFGIFSFLFLLLSIGSGSFVLTEHYLRTPPKSHDIYAFFSMTTFMTSVQLLMFGYMTQTIKQYNHENKELLRESS